jgi:hypothetical protein
MYNGEEVKNMMVINELYISMGCECEQWDNLCIIEMTAETCDYMSNILELIKKRGMSYWWLYLSKCKRCKEYWLIGQDHRINDIYCLYRLNLKQANDIIEKNNWPSVLIDLKIC